MLISCPKCHSIYEIPDNLIPKTGQNFRCQACHNIWHALPQDALGYEEEKDIHPIVEEIEVTEPPYRNYPANKEHFEVPLDGKSSSKNSPSPEVKKDEENKDIIIPQPIRKKELTLSSKSGTFFTISLDNDIKDDNTPHLISDNQETNIKPSTNTLPTKQKTKHYIFAKFMLFVLFIFSLTILLRRDIVVIYPQAEQHYNKIFLSGLNNPEYLDFENVKINELDNNNIELEITIKNNSRYNTYIPNITINNNKTHSINNKLLKKHETTIVKIPLVVTNNQTNYILNFQKK